MFTPKKLILVLAIYVMITLTQMTLKIDCMFRHISVKMTVILKLSLKFYKYSLEIMSFVLKCPLETNAKV